MMETKSPTAGDQFKTIVAEIANDLLDEFYSEAPNANAYGTGYDGEDNHEQETWYLGREHGADGAESDLGIDYWYRKFREIEIEDRGPGRQRRNINEETEYIYGKYGWADTGMLIDETGRLRQLFASAVDDGHLDEAALERFDDAVDAFQDAIRSWRERFDLEDIAGLFHEGDIDTLRDLLAHGDEEGRVVWSLLFSKDGSGDVIPNDVDVPLVSEEDALMLVRTDRLYVEDDGTEKEYAYAAVIGYDDTPQRFFVHRLESDPDVRDPETTWTTELVKEKMGFDRHLWEVTSRDLPHDEIVRVQGDLAVVRHDYRDAMWEHYESVRESRRSEIAAEHADAFAEAHPEIAQHDRLQISSYRGEVRVGREDTETLKQIQDDVGLAEERVRNEQERRGIQRLSAKRRREIVEDLLTDRLVTWTLDHDDVDAATIDDEAEAQAREHFEDVTGQINAVHGNHTMILGPAAEHPDRSFGDDGTLAAYVVPEEANGFVIHDEHRDKELSLGPGVYEIRFLEGYEDQWWM